MDTEGERRMNGQAVHLRPITADDTEKIVAWRNQDFVRKNFIYQKPFTAEGHRAWLKEQVEPGYAAQFIICLEDGREIGSVYLRDIDREGKTAEYGVFIGVEEALGRGFGTQAARLMLDYGFGTLFLDRIFLRFLEGNESARKSYEKAGFQMMEDRRESVCLEQGRKDVFFMNIERGAWERAKRLGTERG